MSRRVLFRRLEVATNIAVLLVAVALLAALAATWFKSPPAPVYKTGLQRGATLPTVSNIQFSVAPRTLLMVLSTKCGYCEQSLPFYQRLIEENSKADNQLQFVGLFSNSEAEVVEYKKRNSLDLKTVANVDPSEVQASGTPTLILVNAEGKVSDLWIGKLSTSDEQQVLATLKSK